MDCLFPLYLIIILIKANDVLTVQEAGRANQRIPDPDVLAFATSSNRAVITQNRKDFFRLHRIQPDRAGIIACTNDNATHR